MCFGGNGAAKRQAAQQRADEEARQNRIKTGQANIDSVFDSTYTPDFFNKIQQDYTGYYNPQVEKQYGDTREKLTFNLGRQGILDSDAAAKQFGDLEETYGREKSNIGNRALEAVQSAKGNIAREKTNLYGLNASTADPSKAQSLAQSALAGITTQPSYTSLGNLFTNFINNAGATASVNAQRQNYLNQPGYDLDNGNGSGRVVYNG
jgi:hypothetical protein